MEVFFELTLDIVNKSLEISEIFLEKDFEIELYNKNGALVIAIMLGPPDANSAIKKENGK